MEIEFYHIDAFAQKAFEGNPAGVCRLDGWIDTQTMQSIAFENNLPETAFYVQKGDHFEIKWFTPTTEVDLCGHATLATAFVEFEVLDNQQDKLVFNSNSGDLIVKKKGKLIQLDFPVDNPVPIEMSEAMEFPFQQKPIEALRGKDDIVLLFDHEKIIQDMTPDLNLIAQLDARGVIVTAPSASCDFVSRFFGPQCGIPEDPVTGSAHTVLIPYWAKKLNKHDMIAQQLSSRGGKLVCKLDHDRVKIAGEAVLYKKGTILLPLS